MSFLKGTFKFAENFLENVDTRAEQLIQPVNHTNTLSSSSILNGSSLGGSSATNPLSSSSITYPVSNQGGGSGNGLLSLHDLTTLPSSSSSSSSSSSTTTGTLSALGTKDSTTITIHPENVGDTGTNNGGNHGSRLLVYDKDNPQMTSLLLEIRSLQQQIQQSKKKENALEEQIKEGFKETERLRTSLTEARNQLAEADFDAIYKLRHEYDTLQQKFMVLNRDYDTLRTSSEQNSNSVRETINASEILVENLQNELMTVRSSSMAREEELVAELAILTQQIITLKQQQQQQQQQQSPSSSGTIPSTDNPSSTLIDTQTKETLASLERELVYERKRYIACEETNRQLRLSTNKELLQKEEYKRNYETVVLQNASLQKHIQELEQQIQKLGTNQESYLVLQRTNTDLAKQLSIQTNEIIDCKTKLKASVSLLSQEQHAHALTRASYDDLQRIVADLQRDKQRLTSTGGNPSSSSSGSSVSSGGSSTKYGTGNNTLSNPRYPSYGNGGKYSTSPTVKFSDFIDRHFGIPVTTLIQNSRKARIGIVLYLLGLQLWTFFLMFLHSHSIPHELHKPPLQ